jgi:hypothetical protein
MNNPEEMSKAMTPNLPFWSYQLQPNSKLALRTRKDLEIHLITRALKDERFKYKLLVNPKALVEQELGTKLSEELEINVFEETEDTVCIVLPCNPYEGVSEEELKASLGMAYEDLAQWVLEQQRNALLDETNSVSMITRAWKDQAFKQELLCNPKTVIEKECRTTISADIEIKVFEETVNILYLVLPQLFDDFGSSRDLPHPKWWLDANVGMKVSIDQAFSAGGTQPDLICFIAACTSFVCVCTLNPFTNSCNFTR